MALKIFDESFDSQIGYKVIFFIRKDCKECFNLIRKYTEIENFFSDINFYEVDVYKNSEFSKSHNIVDLPAVVFYKNDQIIADFLIGKYKTPQNIINFIKVHKEINDCKYLL